MEPSPANFVGLAMSGSPTNTAPGNEGPPLLPQTVGSHYAQVHPWSHEDQHALDRDIVRLSASACLPITWTKQPAFGHIVSRIPGADIPSSEKLTDTLSQELKNYRAQIGTIRGQAATLTCFVWERTVDDALIGTMLVAHNVVCPSLTNIKLPH